MRKTYVIPVIALSTVLALSGCAAQESTAPSEAPTTAGGEILAEQGLADADVVTVIDTLDQTPQSQRATNMMASIRPAELLLSDEQGREESVPMPDDAFYVSFAPYVSQTHPCHFHSLTTCTGELANTEIELTVTNDTDGSVLVDELVTTYDNGFYGLWLPRGIDATIEVSVDGMTAATPVSTSGDEDATCITEPLQLR